MLTIFGLLLAGCSVKSPVQAEAMPETKIIYARAIEIAVTVAFQGAEELSGTKEEPKNIQVELMSCDKAFKQLAKTDPPKGANPDGLVWVVTMEGTWFSEFPRQTDTSTSEPYRHFSIIIDANTGEPRLIGAVR